MDKEWQVHEWFATATPGAKMPMDKEWRLHD
jgi:hypothetical protein